MSKILEVIPGGDWFQNSSDKELEANSSDNTNAELKFIPVSREELRTHLTDEEIETFRVLEGMGRL